MCGIAGFFDPSADRHAATSLLQRMTRSLSHRGPDEDGLHVEGPVGLGHRRLSIIDVDAGRQPIFNEDQSKAIVFNGEIYNFRPLRETLLKAGHRFRTSSDTEVILHAYEEYGAKCVEHLRGMFAFAVWDRRAQALFLARDRVGIKPLYYCWSGKRFLFGSELKAIIEDPSVPRTMDLQALDEYLSYLYVPAPRTIFRNIRKLQPGHTLTVTAEGIHEAQYWDLRFDPDERPTEEDWIEGLREKLRESVSIHLMSEVPLGAFLSGGMDSSAVVALMAGLVDRPIQTATIGFEESGFDELPYARMVAARYRTQAYERTVRASASRILDQLVWHFDEPFADSSMIPTYYVSQVARERVTVCLSGDGGDENFAGYRRYKFDVFENRMRGLLPAGLRRPLFSALSAVYPKADWLPRILRGRTLLQNLSMSPEQGYFNSMTWFSPAMKQVLYREPVRTALKGYQAFSVMQRYFDRTRGWDPLSRIQYVDVKTYLVDDILTKVDRASMAHSLEVRVPLLDHEVMELAARIPSRFKLRHGEGKYILKQVLRDLVPAEAMNRPKMGFSIPLAQWFRGDLKSPFEERMFAKQSFVSEIMDTEAIRGWWALHQRGLRDYAYHLWALLVLESWGRRFMRRSE
ncbi:MAG: amidotransferase 1, exosortase A system-associated [Nitrospirae bacterium]|nr:amidotransferase 1, exosortase A system-associated [Nitrospirota bacterium]